jgi:O-antigen/teichoic acid export membrane protein
VSERNHDSDFVDLLKSAGALGLGRQVGSLAFMASVLVLPAVASRPVVDDFIWAYFAALFLSSILNLGLERAVGPRVAHSNGVALPVVLRRVLVARLYTVPVTAAALWLLYRFVDVRLPVGAWWCSLAWVVAIQVQGVAFAGLRAGGRRGVEPRLALVSRLAEGAGVVGLAAAGASIAVLIALMAIVEVAVAAAAVGSLGGRRGRPADGLSSLPWKTVSAYALIELLAFSYLRVDMALVGNLLGPGPGATYGLVYRVIDALTGLSTPVILLLFPYAARLVATGTGLRKLRDRALCLLPAAAVVLSMAALAVAPVLAAAVPRFAEGLPALRILLVAVPLTFMSSVELHLRSAENRNGEVVTLAAGVLATNIALNLVLIPRYGLNGAAWALCLTEFLQLGAIMLFGPSDQAAVRHWGMVVLGYAGVFALSVVLINAGRVVAGSLAAAGVLLATAVTSLRPGVRQLAVPV